MIEELRSYSFDPLRQGSPNTAPPGITFSCWCTVLLAGRRSVPAANADISPTLTPSDPHDSFTPVPGVVRFVADEDDRGIKALLANLDEAWCETASLQHDLCSIRVVTNMILQRPLDSEVDDLQPLIRNSVVLLAERILLDYDSLFKPGTFHPRFQVRLPRWENAHRYKPSRNTRVDSATKAQSIITSWQLQVPVPITAASLPSPEPSTLSSRAQPSVDPSPPTKRRRLTSPSQASGDPSTTRSTSTSSTRPLHITSSLPVIEEPAPVIPDAANDDNRSIPIPGITLADSELIQMEVTQLSGGWSDLALVTQGTHCLFEIKLLSALTTTAFEAFLRTLRRAPVDMSATGFEPNQPLNRSNLAVHFTWGPDPQAADGGLSETMQKVLGQVFQQLILNRCPRLILSNWDVYVLVWLGADGRVHISRAFSRARDHNRRLRPNMDESPLELLVALQVLVVRLMQAADADTAAEKAECLQAVDPIWQYDGEDWFHNDNARANSVSQPVVGPNRSGGNGGGGSRGRRGSRVGTRGSGGRPSSATGGQGSRSGSQAQGNDSTTGNQHTVRNIDRTELPTSDSDTGSAEPMQEDDHSFDNVDAVEFAAMGSGTHVRDRKTHMTVPPSPQHILTVSWEHPSSKWAHLIPAMVGTPSLVLAIPGSHLSDLSRSNVDRQLHLVLGNFIGQGRTGIVFHARVNNQRVVAKVVDLTPQSPLWSHPDSYNTPAATLRAAVSGEALLYARELRPLQGVVVPVFYGMWVSTHLRSSRPSLAIVLLSDSGVPIDENVAQPTQCLAQHEQAIRNAYNAIWGCFVLHGDVAPRHILVRNGRVNIIDFEASLTAFDGAGQVAKERARVENMFQDAHRLDAPELVSPGGR